MQSQGNKIVGKSPSGTLVFDCPLCGNASSVTQERGVYAGAGVIHHCASCGGEVVFQPLTVERYLESISGGGDCCCLAPQCGYEPSTLIAPGSGGAG